MFHRHGAVWGDYDNDGYLDLFVSVGLGGNDLLYRNHGDGTFSKITSGPPVQSGGNSRGCAWGDYDNDGYLDLFVANEQNQNNFLFHNNGDGTFSKITSGNIANDGGASYGCAWATMITMDFWICLWPISTRRTSFITMRATARSPPSPMARS